MKTKYIILVGLSIIIILNVPLIYIEIQHLYDQRNDLINEQLIIGNKIQYETNTSIIFEYHDRLVELDTQTDLINQKINKLHERIFFWIPFIGLDFFLVYKILKKHGN
jgi:hypothetical protein